MTPRNGLRRSRIRSLRHYSQKPSPTQIPKTAVIPEYRPSHKPAPVVIKTGSGGRSSVSGHTATVFGATGFVGRYLVNHLGKQGTSVVVPYRGEKDDYRHLKPMGDLGQIVPLFFHAFDQNAIEECVRHSDIVYNLIGRDYPTKNFTFEDVHVRAAANIARACRDAGIPRLIHLSSIKASPNSRCGFLSSKAKGEIAVRDVMPDATVVRVSDLYGHEDRFLHKIAWLSKLPGGVPLTNDGKTVLRPTCVSDVGNALANMLHKDDIEGKDVELFSEHEYTYEEIVDLFFELVVKRPRKLHIPAFVAERIFYPFWVYFLPRMTTWDVQRLTIDDVPKALGDSSIWTYPDVGVARPKVLEYVALEYLRMYRDHDDYHLPGRVPPPPPGTPLRRGFPNV